MILRFKLSDPATKATATIDVDPEQFCSVFEKEYERTVKVQAFAVKWKTDMLIWGEDGYDILSISEIN